MEVECEVVDWNLLVQEGEVNHRLFIKSQYHPVLESAECIIKFHPLHRPPSPLGRVVV
jgi:hypothetical protein